jgi:FtsP/CotA-like multicopper oxidase with cupredoxin domain
MPMMNWLSTSEQVEWILRDTDTGAENAEIDWRFEVGDVVKIRVHNTPDSFHPMNHPFHIHGQRFLVLAMDGVERDNLVWKDTAIVPVGSTMDILVEMSNPGTWMAHCHIAEHLESGMMFNFEVVGR